MEMQFLLKEGTEDNELVTKDVEKDVLFIQHFKKQYTKIYTENNGILYSTTKLFELEMKLKQLDFLMLSRDSLVNMKKIKSFNEKTGQIYFEYSPTKSSLSVHTVKAAYPRIEKYFDLSAARNKEFQGGFLYR